MDIRFQKTFFFIFAALTTITTLLFASCSHVNAADNGTTADTSVKTNVTTVESTQADTLTLPETGTFQATARDSSIFYAYRSKVIEQRWDTLPLNSLIIHTGEFFLGTPYVSHTLEVNNTEQLIINLMEMDCATFMEQSLALALTASSGDFTFERLVRTLRTLRYRNAKTDGYASRLHYLEDWIYENERNGFVSNITQELGGTATSKVINYMTTHTDIYKNLHEQRDIDTLKMVERRMSQSERYVILRNNITPQILSKFQDGDIIAFTTDVKGLDCAHVGFARRGTDGTVHFLHCSLSNHKVLLTSRSLTQYMSNKKHFTGIEVIRPKQ